tara:strand:- start:2264 stop:2485 length:222 start_codon:yes stop_codon:yes gene_type:complete
MLVLVLTKTSEMKALKIKLIDFLNGFQIKCSDNEIYFIKNKKFGKTMLKLSKNQTKIIYTITFIIFLGLLVTI